MRRVTIRHYTLGSLETAQISGSSANLGAAQGWTNSNSLRLVHDINGDGRPDIVAFGAPGVFVALGQDPATHGGQAFGQLYLALNDFGLNQGWSNTQTPRLVGDVNGDGVADLVGFGASSTFAALGTKNASDQVTWAIDPNLMINDFGYNEGWKSF